MHGGAAAALSSAVVAGGGAAALLAGQWQQHGCVGRGTGSFCLLLCAYAGLAAFAAWRWPRFPARPWLAVTTFTVAVLLAELVLSVALVPRETQHVVTDLKCHHLNRPGDYVLPKPDGTTVAHVNALQLRGPERQREKPPGTRRILMLGDSFTFGISVRDEETFSALLEERLSSGAQPVEVLNGGTDSAAAIVSACHFRNYFGQLDPDLVVLNVDMSDPMQEIAYRLESTRGRLLQMELVPLAVEESCFRGADGWAATSLFLGRQLVYHARFSLPGGSSSLDEALRNGRRLLAHTTADFTGDRRELLAPLVESIAELDSQVRARGARLLVTTYPWGHQVAAREWAGARHQFDLPPERALSDETVRVLEQACRDRGIAFLDAFPRFRAYRGEALLYNRVDMHWTPAGHRVMAEALEERIRTDQLLPR
jgi:lysophospholipase L1-like esterase